MRGATGRIQVTSKASQMELNDASELSDALLSLPALTSSPQDTVNTCLQRAKLTLSFAQTHPAIPLALQKCTSDIDTLTRHMLNLALFGKLNNYNDHFLQHIIAAHLATYYLVASNLASSKLVKKSKDEAISQKKALLAFINDHHLTMWRQIIALQKVLFSSQSIKHVGEAKLTSLQRISLITSVFSYCTGAHSRSSLLAFIAQRVPTMQRTFLHPIASLISIPSPGAKVYVKAHPAIVIDIQKQHALVHSPSRNEDEKILWVKRTALFAPKDLYLSFEEFTGQYQACENARSVKGEQPFYPATFPIQRPPSALIAIIDELQKTDVDVPSLCQKVEKVPSFQQFLLSTASLDNRLKLTVTSLKQAILTYGLERVGDMLVQHALIERLTQHQYPLLAISKQFTTLACGIAAQLASITKTKFTPQSAALVTTFLCAPLFTLPGLKVATKLPVSQKDYFQIDKAFKVKSVSSWHAISGELAGNWHQSATWRAVIHQSGRRHAEVAASLKKEHAILQLAFGLAREYLFPLNARDAATDNTFDTLVRSVNLKSEDIRNVMDRLGEYLFCPLNLH
ncbi:histidine kinase [Alteromonas stellipolaris]|uniref:histidine kinase n=1 Tax=Alteromonas stellipolaris TaxID=233316 RepID=UPI001428A0A9|nr:histidine kinase [Alteromonas stellipolaris]